MKGYKISQGRIPKSALTQPSASTYAQLHTSNRLDHFASFDNGWFEDSEGINWPGLRPQLRRILSAILSYHERVIDGQPIANSYIFGFAYRLHIRDRDRGQPSRETIVVSSDLRASRTEAELPSLPIEAKVQPLYYHTPLPRLTRVSLARAICDAPLGSPLPCMCIIQ